MSDPVLSVRNLSKLYRLGSIGKHTLYEEVARLFRKQTDKAPVHEEFWALKDVSFDVNAGEIVGVVGSNGAGKSTLLKILSRITEPTEGEARIQGRVGSLLEVGTGFHPELTARENVMMNGTLLGMRKKEVLNKLEEIVEFSGVGNFIDTPVKRYSSGMYVRLAFAIAAHFEPEILIVDEVLAVGDTEFQNKCLGKMNDVASHGRTVLFVSHNLATIENLCPTCLYLRKGRVASHGDTRGVLAEYLQDSQQNLEKFNILGGEDPSLARSGNGDAIFTRFEFVSGQGLATGKVQSGGDLTLRFTVKNQTGGTLPKVDLGFSFSHDTGKHLLGVLYGSYQRKLFNLPPGESVVTCHLRDLPLTPGRYQVGGRIECGGKECDMPDGGLGWLDVVEGDFYGTGRSGLQGKCPMMFRGEWDANGAEVVDG